jgi:hypothetical protein
MKKRKKFVIRMLLRETPCSHGGEYENGCLLGCCALIVGGSQNL